MKTISKIKEYFILFVIYMKIRDTTEYGESWKYSINEDGTITITKRYYNAPEDINDEEREKFCYVNVPSEIDGYKVTKIGRDAFSDSNIESITIPKGVDEIEENAFRDCYLLAKVELPETLESIGINAFCESGLESIVIPDSVNEIGEGAFFGCRHLESVKYINKDTVGETQIGIGAFERCDKLNDVSLPSNLERIEDFTFNGCTSLKNIELPKYIKYIGTYAFGNTGLESIVIPDSVTGMDSCVFCECEKLENVEYSKKEDKIYVNMFFGCSNLKKFDIQDSIKEIKEGAFTGSGIEELYIPDSVLEIKPEAVGFKYDKNTDKVVKDEKFKIYCHKDSAAQQYAEEYGIKYEIK